MSGIIWSTDVSHLPLLVDVWESSLENSLSYFLIVVDPRISGSVVFLVIVVIVVVVVVSRKSRCIESIKSAMESTSSLYPSPSKSLCKDVVVVDVDGVPLLLPRVIKLPLPLPLSKAPKLPFALTLAIFRLRKDSSSRRQKALLPPSLL